MIFLNNFNTETINFLEMMKKEFSDKRKQINLIALNSQELKNDFLNLIDEDTEAFNCLMNSFRLPKKTDQEIKYRNSQILEMSKLVTEVPFSTLEKCSLAMDLVLDVLKIGNTNCISDAAVAGEMGCSSAYGAYYNVKINLLDLKENKKYCKSIHDKSKAILKEIDKKNIKIRNIVNKKLD